MMPGMDGYETCRRIREEPTTSFVPVVMVTASGDAEKVRAHRGRGRRLHHQAARPGRAAGAGALAGAGQALPRHRHRAGGRARRAEPAPRGARRRPGRRARPARPAAPLPVAADRPDRGRHRRRVVPAQPPPRDRLGVHRPARLHRVRRERRAGGDHGGAGASTTWRSASWCSRTRAPSSTSPATGCSSSSTTPSPARTHRTARCGWRVDMRARVAELAEGWRRKGHDLGFGVGIAQGYATLGRVGFPGRYDYAAIGTVTNLAARLCAMAAGRPDPRLPAGAARDRRAGRLSRGRPPGAQGLQPAGGGVRGHRPAAGRGAVMSDRRGERTDARRARRGRPQRGLRPAPGADAGGVDRDAARRRRASRWSSCRR